jgi:uncharacterized membrane protein YeaQ/YmgE (transglycosylase-associated protein family)
METLQMSGVGIIGAIIIGILAGWIAEKVMRRNHGLLTNLIVGLVGALLGSFVASLMGVGPDGWISSLVVSTLGAILLLFLVGMIRRRA